VTVTCRVLNIARQPYYRWLENPVTEVELAEAYLANALFDAHRDDPEFGYRFLADEARDAGLVFADRTAWRICRDNGWWSVFGKKGRGKRAKVGVPAHDDLVRREFTATGPNRVWLADITEHPTREGKLYLCAVKDVWSNRIVGYSMAERMESAIAVAALDSAVARRGGEVAGCVLHSDRGSQGGFNWSSQHLVITEVFDGSWTAGCRSRGAFGDEVARCAAAPTRGAAIVLDRDRRGCVAGGGSYRRRRVATGRSALVPQRWRHAAIRSDAVVRPLPVVS
jgi:putative transposase